MVEESGVEPPFFQVLLCSYHVNLSAPLIHFRSLRAPCIPATSKLPGNVARLVVNHDSFYT